MTTITVRPGGINPDVTFERTFYGEPHVRQVDDVIETWTRITGLNFEKMPLEWKVIDAAGDKFVWVKVVHPLVNRPDVFLFWPAEQALTHFPEYLINVT